MPSVLVLMSTYNGEKYIVEQIESIINQKEVDVTILIADDCSTDNTTRILEEYSIKYENIKYIVNEKNKNFTYNFIDLIFKCNDLVGYFDYYALSDQDDVWLDRKLINGISKISDDSPMLYMSNLNAVDADLNFLRKKQEDGCNGCNHNNYVFENICTGCTCIFNNKFLDRLKEYYPNNIYLHDYWIFLVAAYTAYFVYDDNSYILYRQHNNNQLGLRKKRTLFHKIKMCFKKGKRTESKLCFELLKGYEKYIDSKYDVIKYMTVYKKKINIKLKLMFSKKYKRRTDNFEKKIKLLFNKY